MGGRVGSGLRVIHNRLTLISRFRRVLQTPQAGLVFSATPLCQCLPLEDLLRQRPGFTEPGVELCLGAVAMPKSA